MPENRPNSLNQLLQIWTRLKWSQRLSILFFGFIGLTLIGGIAFFLNRMDYEVLYRDLAPEDAQAVIAKLKEQKKKFIVDGTSVKVAAPKTEIDQLRIEMAGSGIGRSGKIGYEIFDKNQFGMTDFTEQVNLQRAYEGELTRSISNLEEVAQARVHLVLPKQSVFDENKEEAKASVIVRLKSGAELSKSSIAGIKGICAGAVPGLRSSNVSIIDSEGQLLSRSVESGDSGRVEIESGVREQFEKEVSNKVISILEPLVGKGKVHANASIDLDFNSMEQTEESFNPSTPIILSQQKSEERSGGSNSTAGGTPGGQGNNSTGAQNAASGAERVKQTESTNYEVNKVVRHTIQPKGSIIRRMTVAAILDHKTVYTKSKTGKISAVVEPRSQKEIDSFRELVLAAVGYDEQRGDIVTIENVPFYAEMKTEEQVQLRQQLQQEEQQAVPWYVKWQVYLLPAMKYGSLLVLFIIAYYVLIRPVRRRVIYALAAVTPQGMTETVHAQLPGESSVRALAGMRQGEEASAVSGGTMAGLPPADMSPVEEFDAIAASEEQGEHELSLDTNQAEAGSKKHAAMKKKLVDKARKEPEMVSQLVRSWLRNKE